MRYWPPDYLVPLPDMPPPDSVPVEPEVPPEVPLEVPPPDELAPPDEVPEPELSGVGPGEVVVELLPGEVDGEPELMPEEEPDVVPVPVVPHAVSASAHAKGMAHLIIKFS